MVDPRRLSEWMTIISFTEDEEMDCDALVEVAAEVVQTATQGADVRQIAPLFACPRLRILASNRLGGGESMTVALTIRVGVEASSGDAAVTGLAPAAGRS